MNMYIDLIFWLTALTANILYVGKKTRCKSSEPLKVASHYIPQTHKQKVQIDAGLNVRESLTPRR